MKRGRRIFVGKVAISFLFLSFVFAFMVSFSSFAVANTILSSPSNCCEKTKDGALCVNTEVANCAPGFKSSPTSCESTSYCRLGTCYDSSEGLCMENTPQSICDQTGGTWDPRSANEVPQCQLGCCLIGDQAAFVSLTRCKKLSTSFGVENNYRTDITNEATCIATAQASETGACVFEKDFERICKFTTRADCGASNSIDVVNKTGNEKTFYSGLLCSAEELNTACARQTSTMCDAGQVFWKDSCGNKENIYSSDKVKSWNNGRVLSADEVCDPNDGSDTDCGNCNYLLGTRCENYKGVLGIGKPEGSDYYCKRTECLDRNGKPRINGESWCVNDGQTGNGQDKVGSRFFREICVDGNVQVEACGDFRSEVCIDGSIPTSAGDFGVSACRVNRWRDCLAQTEEDDCENIDRRDCSWVEGDIVGLGTGVGATTTKPTSFSNPSTTNTFNNPTAKVIAPITGNVVANGDGGVSTGEGFCVPSNPPGLEFWADTGAKNVCGQASAKCTVKKEKGLLEGSWDVVEGEECLREDWAANMNYFCSSLGDCGGYVNYVGTFTGDGYNIIVDGEKKEFSPNTANKISGGLTELIKENMGEW